MNSFENTVEPGLIRKSTLRGNVGKGQAGICHKIFGSIHTAFCQPLIGCHAKRLFEGAGKVAY